jgi:hypothetical protein
MEYILDEIEVCECVGYFEDEIVYDIEMNDESHTFIANDILVHNTDSLYISYKPLLETIEGIENMDLHEVLNIILELNLNFLDQHNFDYIKAYYDKRHGKSVHKFELETVNKRGVWLRDTKKRYGQVLLWKDGKTYDLDDLPVKVKGLEVVKASYPTLSRTQLKSLLRFLLEYDGKYLVQELNLLNIKFVKEFEEAPIDNVCGNIKVNGYMQKIISDTNPNGFQTKPGASFNVKALAMYNWLNNTKKLGSEPIYGGKLKIYTIKGSSAKKGDIYFAYESTKYPKWGDKYAPIDRRRMYQKYVLDPFNRILESANLPILHADGSIQMSLFD